MKFKSVTYIDFTFKNCYFDDVTSLGTYFRNCTFLEATFYNTGEICEAVLLQQRSFSEALAPCANWAVEQGHNVGHKEAMSCSWQRRCVETIGFTRAFQSKLLLYGKWPLPYMNTLSKSMNNVMEDIET